MDEGGRPWSTETSPHARYRVGSKTVAARTVSSPARKNPKKQAAAAAQTMRLSPSSGHKADRICLRMWGVIGRRGLDGGDPDCTRSRRTPLCKGIGGAGMTTAWAQGGPGRPGRVSPLLGKCLWWPGQGPAPRVQPQSNITVTQTQEKHRVQRAWNKMLRTG